MGNKINGGGRQDAVDAIAVTKPLKSSTLVRLRLPSASKNVIHRLPVAENRSTAVPASRDTGFAAISANQNAEGRSSDGLSALDRGKSLRCTRGNKYAGCRCRYRIRRTSGTWIQDLYGPAADAWCHERKVLEVMVDIEAIVRDALAKSKPSSEVPHANNLPRHPPYGSAIHGVAASRAQDVPQHKQAVDGCRQQVPCAGDKNSPSKCSTTKTLSHELPPVASGGATDYVPATQGNHGRTKVPTGGPVLPKVPAAQAEKENEAESLSCAPLEAECGASTSQVSTRGEEQKLCRGQDGLGQPFAYHRDSEQTPHDQAGLRGRQVDAGEGRLAAGRKDGGNSNRTGAQNFEQMREDNPCAGADAKRVETETVRKHKQQNFSDDAGLQNFAAAEAKSSLRSPGSPSCTSTGTPGERVLMNVVPASMSMASSWWAFRENEVSENKETDTPKLLRKSEE